MGSFKLDELEQMALSFGGDVAVHIEDIHETADRWIKLFGYSHYDEIYAIKRHRSDLSRKHVPQASWDMVIVEQETLGYDQEAYEHELARQAKQVLATSPEPENDSTNMDLQGRYLTVNFGILTQMGQHLFFLPDGTFGAVSTQRLFLHDLISNSGYQHNITVASTMCQLDICSYPSSAIPVLGV